MIQYANTLGWSGQESSFFATTDAAGNVYLAGTTTSQDFPATVRFSNSTNFQGVSLFVVKIDPSGARLLFSTIIGGAVPGAIALDSSGNVYVAGEEAAANYPTTAGIYSPAGNCFVSKLDPTGAKLVYSTRLACANSANVAGLAVDSGGNAYLTGSSTDSLVTTPGAYKTTGSGAFALKLNPAGSGLVYSTFLPPAGPAAIAVDAAGAAYIAGSASIQTFQPMPDTLPHEQASGSGTTTADAMVLKLSPGGSAIEFASLFGGTGADLATAVAVGADGSVYVSGTSHATTGFGATLPFPTTRWVPDTVTGFPKGFAARLTPGGEAFQFSTFLTGSATAPCLEVTDAGVDVLATFATNQSTPNFTGAQIMRFSLDGRTLIHSSIASSGSLSGCGQGAGNFVVLGSTFPPGSIIISPNLSPIGSKTNVAISVITADKPGAPHFSVNTGEVNLLGWRAPDGTFTPVRQVIHATADNEAVAVSAAANVAGNPVTLDPAVTTTPADITVVANQGSYGGELILFAPGTEDGLVLASVNMTPVPTLFTLSPASLQFMSASGASTPVTATVHASTSVVSDAFGTVLSVPVKYSVDTTLVRESNSPSAPLPSWLTVTDNGTTPEDVTFTANPKGLADGLETTLVRFMGAGQATPAGFPNISPVPAGYLGTSLQIGAAPVSPTVPALTATPSSFTLRFTDASQEEQSATVHLATSADPANFFIAQLPAWLAANPSNGRTPADITFTATPPGNNGPYVAALGVDINGTFVGTVEAYVDVALPGYVGPLSVTAITDSLPSTSRGIAQGSLFYIYLNHPELIPNETDPAVEPVSSMAGYSFTANGAPVPLIAYQSEISVGQFLAQMPIDAKLGGVTIDAFDSSGTLVATASTTVTAIAPDFVTDPRNPRAQKADGSTIDANNPVAPGDAVLVHVTGLGPASPPLASGAPGIARRPVARPEPSRVTATIGGKNAPLISVRASASPVGVADIWLTVPDLYDGDHYISVGAMGAFTSTRIPIKVKNP